MADQNITALPQTTTPETSDQLLIVGATEEKLIDYEKLADAILTKLTSKTFALNQGTMTLLQALNELNSNSGIYNYAGLQYSTNLLQPYISKSSGSTAPSSIIVIGYEGISLLKFVTMNVDEVPSSYVNITGDLVTKTSDGTIAIATYDRNRQITIISSRTVIISVRAVS